MKKFVLFFALIFMAGLLSAQQRVPGKDAITISDKNVIIPDGIMKEATDTLIPFGIANRDSLTVYPSDNVGYITGVNGYGDMAIAQQYPVVDAYYVEGFLIYFGVKDVVGAADNLDAVMWDIDQGEPDVEMARITLNVGSDVTTAGYTSIDFADSIVVDNDYFLGVDLSTLTDDTLAVVSSNDGSTTNRYAWVQFSDGSWSTIDEAWSDNMDIALVILAVVDQSTMDINEQSFINGIKMETYPNPASDVVNMDYQLENASDVTIKILDVTGKVVQTEELGQKEAGQHKATFSASRLDAGMYFYIMEAGNNRLAKRMVIK